MRCARAVRKVGYFGSVSPDGHGNCNNDFVPIQRTAQILTQSKNSAKAMFHTENAGLLSTSAVCAMQMDASLVVGGLQGGHGQRDFLMGAVQKRPLRRFYNGQAASPSAPEPPPPSLPPLLPPPLPLPLPLKASVEITSRYTGVVTKLHHNVGDMARVGEPLIGLEVPDTKDAGPKQTPVASSTPTPPPTPPPSPPPPTPTEAAPRTAPPSAPLPSTPATAPTPHPSGPVLCTPAVRAIAKEHNIDLRQVPGTGKDGRVMKEDILHYIKQVRW